MGSLSPEHFQATGARNMLVQWARHGIIPSLSGRDHLPRPQPNDKSIRQHATFVRNKLARMLAADVVSITDRQPNFLMPLKLVPKANGKPRLVHNTRKLNKRTRAPSFHLPTPYRIVKQVPRGAYMTRFDVSNAYWTVPLHPDHRHDFGFAFEGQWYVWNRIPFGWNVSSWVLYTCMEHVRKSLFQRFGIRVFIYSDDILMIAPDHATALRHTSIVLDELRAFGFAVQEAKCHLAPTQDITYLGMRIRTDNCTVRLTSARQQAYIRMLHSLRRLRRVPLLWLQQVVGHLNFVAPVWPGSRILFNTWIRTLASVPPGSPPTRFVPVDPLPFPALLGVITRNAPFRFHDVEHAVYSDATLRQGAFCYTPSVGYAAPLSRHPAIFVQETRAAADAIVHAATRFPSSRIVAYIDNTAALGALRKGTTAIADVWPDLLRVFLALDASRCSISFRYVRSARNPADFFSRLAL